MFEFKVGLKDRVRLSQKRDSRTIKKSLPILSLSQYLTTKIKSIVSAFCIFIYGTVCAFSGWYLSRSCFQGPSVKVLPSFFTAEYYSTVYIDHILLMHLLLDEQFASLSWLLWIMLLQTLMYKYFKWVCFYTSAMYPKACLNCWVTYKSCSISK